MKEGPLRLRIFAYIGRGVETRPPLLARRGDQGLTDDQILVVVGIEHEPGCP
jgi:hypothetical protein